jgi:hypothetical protein
MRAATASGGFTVTGQIKHKRCPTSVREITGQRMVSSRVIPQPMNDQDHTHGIARTDPQPRGKLTTTSCSQSEFLHASVRGHRGNRFRLLGLDLD